MTMSKKQKQELYDEIVRLYDFTEDIINAIERKESEDPALELDLVTPLVEELHNCADILSETYIDYVESNEQAGKGQILRVEKAVRRVFAKAWEFIEEIQKLPENLEAGVEVAVEGILKASKEIKDGILPTIEELVSGPTHKMLADLMKVYSRFKVLLKAIQENLAHIFRVTYRLAQPDIGLINKPQYAIPGRIRPDLEAQALSEREKSLERTYKDLTQADSAIELANKYAAKDGDPRL